MTVNVSSGNQPVTSTSPVVTRTGTDLFAEAIVTIRVIGRSVVEVTSSSTTVTVDVSNSDPDCRGKRDCHTIAHQHTVNATTGKPVPMLALRCSKVQVCG